MKRLTILALVFILALSCMTGCRGRMEDMTNTTGTTETPRATTPDSGNILPDAEEMLPDENDTIDPSNGATDGMVDPTNGANHDATDSTENTGARNRTRRHPAH